MVRRFAKGCGLFGPQAAQDDDDNFRWIALHRAVHPLQVGNPSGLWIRKESCSNSGSRPTQRASFFQEAFCSASLLLCIAPAGRNSNRIDTSCRGAQFFGGTPSFQARVLVCSNKVKQFIRSDATDMCIPGTACGGKRMSKGEEQGKPQAREHASVPSA